MSTQKFRSNRAPHSWSHCFVLALVAVFASIAPHATLAASKNGVQTPPFKRVTLDNGAVLLLMERRDVPLITFNAVLRGGAIADPESALGMSSLLAGLLEKGAGKRDAQAFAEAVASVGGQIETGAALESIGVSGSFLARDRRLMIELLADMLERPRLDREELEALRARRIELIRAAKDSDLAALVPIYGSASLFAAHPYGRPVNGSESSLAAIEHADVLRHYREHLGADRLILAVAGDFETDEIERELKKAFASWRKAAAPLPSPGKPAAPAGRRVLLIDAPDSVQSYFWAGSLGVARDDPRRAALDVSNTLFGGRFTSMLNTELRVRSGLSYGAGSRFDRAIESGHWQLTSFTRTETTIEAIDLALATLAKLHDGALDESMLASAKAYVQGQFPLALETAGQWAYQLASLELYGLDRRYIDGYFGALEGVSLADARRVVDEVFPRPDGLVLVVIGKAAAIRDELRKYGPVTEMKLADPLFAPAQRTRAPAE